MSDRKKRRYCVYEKEVGGRLRKLSGLAYNDIQAALKAYPNIGFYAVVAMVAHKAATIATNSALGKPLDRMWKDKP